MRVIRSVTEMQVFAFEARKADRILALVPTMGYLHAGHLSLVKIARAKSDVLVVSIFVNPTQFGQDEDLDRYPRNFERDKQACVRAGVDVVFCPDSEQMYDRGHSVVVEETSLSRSLCGASRPGHFRGVATVVAKLFNITLPHLAVFGQKDAQQVRVIQKMVRDLNFPVKILVGPTVRDRDGLATSSRNSLLTPEQRQCALCLYDSLKLAMKLHGEGSRHSDDIKKHMMDVIARESAVDVDYVEIVDADTFEPIGETRNSALAVVAANVGPARLIDNVILGNGDEQPVL